MDLELKDKIAFIAGSTRGIGFAIAQAFLKEGAKVVITGACIVVDGGQTRSL